MADPSLYTFPSPLEGYEGLEPLPDEMGEDGKSYKNVQTGKLSKSYETFTDGLDNGARGGFDVHSKSFLRLTILGCLACLPHVAGNSNISRRRSRIGCRCYLHPRGPLTGVEEVLSEYITSLLHISDSY